MLQALVDHFSEACKDFGPTISLKKTNVLGQNRTEPPAVSIVDYELDAVHQFTLIGSTITDNLSPDSEIDKETRKADAFSRLTSRLWTNSKLVKKTKVAVCKLVSSTHCYMAVRLGPRMPDRREDSTPSTCEQGRRPELMIEESQTNRSATDLLLRLQPLHQQEALVFLSWLSDVAAEH